MYSNKPLITGFWKPKDGHRPDDSEGALKSALLRVKNPVFVLDMNGKKGVAEHGRAEFFTGTDAPEGSWWISGYVPPLLPENLGDSFFKRMLGIKYPYVAGAMAHGITSEQMVEAAARAGMIGFFGSAGLMPEQVAEAIDRLSVRLEGLPFGANLIYSPDAPELERKTAELYLEKGLGTVSASAYMRLTPWIVLYRVRGLRENPDGTITAANRVIAKVSREEVASRFLSPPPEKTVSWLVEQKLVTRQEAALAAHIPMADAITAEADSGGHTDNRPAIPLLGTMLALRDRMRSKYGYQQKISVGLAGGIATPSAVAGAFSMGADYVLTGSINQSCKEAGISGEARQMLAGAGQADTAMAPSADMFERGGKVQVLKRGTMFAMRAAKLYECYRKYPDFESIPAEDRETIEGKILRAGFEDQWEQTRKFFLKRNPGQVEKAERDPRHRMALVFRSYLGLSSMWARNGDSDRRADYQIWCGPAMGAFNEWARGSFLENPENRDIVSVAMNLLTGASVLCRAFWLRTQGVQIPAEADSFSPVSLDELNRLAGAERGNV